MALCIMGPSFHARHLYCRAVIFVYTNRSSTNGQEKTGTSPTLTVLLVFQSTRVYSVHPFERSSKVL